MNAPASPPAEAAGSQQLAEQIYVELLGRAFLRVDNAAVIKPEPADLARLSLQLAHAFREVERKIASDAGPKNVGYDLKSADWIK